MRARFLVNLRNLTISDAFIAHCAPQGYLAPPTYLTAATREFAGSRSGRLPLLVDNGRFDDISAIARRESPAIEALLAQALPATKQHGNTGRKISGPHLDALKVLVGQLVSDCQRTQPALTIDQQLDLKPTGVVGFEDISAATLLRAGMDLDLIPDGRNRLKRWNTAVAKRAAAEVQAFPEPDRIILTDSASNRRKRASRYYVVMSALDYDTAFDAGRVLATHDLSFAAVGFGAFMADDAYTTRYKQRGRWRELPNLTPQRYLRTALVARGLFDGMNAGGPSQLRAFHFLGLGAPIMLGLAALAAHPTPEITFDATSPIRDATQGTMYFLDPAPLSIRTRRMAANLLDLPGYVWPCSCPFCHAYLAEHPFDLAHAQHWRGLNPLRPITAADLRASAPLGMALPLLAEPAGGPARREVDLARIGHNHWTLQKLLSGINRHARTRSQLHAWVSGQVENYAQATNSASFAQAVRQALMLIAEPLGASRALAPMRVEFEEFDGTWPDMW